MRRSASGYAIRPLQRFRERKAVATSYAIDPRRIALVGILFPGGISLPSSLTLPLAGALTLLRVCILFGSMVAFDELRRKLLYGGFVLVLSDIAVGLTSVCMIGALYSHSGAAALTSYGAFAAMELVLAYLIGRVIFGTPVGYSMFISILRWVIGAVFFFALCDTVSGFNIINHTGMMISGNINYADFTAYRFGVIRAQGPMEHPILLGTFFVISIIIILHSLMDDVQKVIWCTISFAGITLALSSAPFIAFFISSGIMLYYRKMIQFPWKSPVLVLAIAYGILCVLILFDNPIETLIKSFTLDPQTGLYRMQIWRWVAVNVMQSPLTGIGYADWTRAPDMSATIDSLWLIQTIRHGLPSTALLMLSMISTGICISIRGRPRYKSNRIDQMKRGVGLAIFVFFFNAFTVHIWGVNWVLLAALIGMRAGLTESEFLPPQARGEAPPRLDPHTGGIS